MGACRLFLRHNEPDPAATLLAMYMRRENPYDALYFLEPLRQLSLLHCKAIEDIESKNAINWQRSVIDFLYEKYLPADETDLQNFTRFVIDPLRLLETDSRSLMEIRFCDAQKNILVSKIKDSVTQQQPLSIVRLGDGEAYPYRPPPVTALNSWLFLKDIENFELRTWGQSPPPGDLSEDYKVRFREAISRADIVGLPSVYRIIRNLTAPYTRYGNRRYQRSFMRILSAVGSEIPLSGKLFTEERCQRISGAIDDKLLIDLAGKSRSVILISCHEEITRKFEAYSPTLILIPSDISLFIRNYKEVIGRIKKSCRPGTLVVIGAGQIGKILADEARQAGAVALDVGSLLDYMVGLKTRTIADLV